MSHKPLIPHADNLLPFDGEAFLYPDVFTGEENNHLLQILREQIAWRQEAIRIFGKTVLQPRLTAWYGNEGAHYSYSGITMEPLPWIPELRQLKEQAEQYAVSSFNSALLNLYRNGQDSMGWHRDNEKELGPEPVIASLSFGAARTFRFRHYQDKKRIISLNLQPGSLLIMSGTTQLHWEHQLPKTAGVVGERINITFRTIQL